jgi:hypothetical protein
MFIDQGHSCLGRGRIFHISDINNWMLYFPTLFVVLETDTDIGIYILGHWHHLDLKLGLELFFFYI